jgi:hypothetical protein
MPTPYELRHRLQAISINADQTEVDAIRRGSVVIDAGIRDDTISGALDDALVVDGTDDAPMGNEHWNIADLQLDEGVGGIREEIERRCLLLSSAYPFQLRDERLVYSPSNSGCYEFCLATCQAQSITRKPFVKFPRGFERLCAKLVERYMGVDAASVHVGWPRDDSVGRNFRTAMKKLERAPYEWIWHPEVGKPEDPAQTCVKDEGVDFVVVKRLLDDRAGWIYVLGQCACGDDWDTKWNELNESRLKKWFRTLAPIPFVRAFATPYLLADEVLRDATAQAGVTFDRARLTSLAERYLNSTEIIEVSDTLCPISSLVLAA